ncbi:MAG TPA: hypothetical protein PKE69_08500 [Pyrinomonadaceae bacterium]|nr:hypothetical protein [Pyrinomonadaceae bacterium]
MFILYLILLILYIASASYAVYSNYSNATLIAGVAGLVATGRLFLQELAKKNLRLYIAIERLKLKIKPDTTSKWWFHARYDDINSENVLNNIFDALKASRFVVKQLSKTDREIELEIDETIRVNISLTPFSESSFNVNHIDVVSRKLEVSYGRAKEKLSAEIEPFLQLLERELKPKSRSLILNIEFMGNNPFFNIYIANLPPSQVEDFRVILHIDGNSPNNERDRVEISKSKVRITADSTTSFKELAESFILLTPNTKLLLGEKNV